MLDTAKMLRLAREAKRDVLVKHRFNQKPNDWRKTVYVSLDVQLAKLVDQLGWFKGWQGQSQAPIDEVIMQNYVQTMNLFLWLALAEQWTHLVVLEADELEKLQRMPKRDLNAHYLGIKNMLWNCYLQGNQTSYKHAWHSFIKFGLVELNLSQDNIQEAFEENMLEMMQD